jgi:hypothetical protein
MKILTYILAAVMAANGLYMFVEPAGWYATVPGVPDTGPFNPHFVRDIGIAFFTAGAALLWSVLGAGWRASALGAMFIGLHSLLHIGETIGGHHHNVLLNEIVAVHLPAVLAVVISYFQYKASN